MTKTLTQHLETIKREGKGIFLPYIMAGDHEKGLAGLAETIAFLENLGVSAIETWACQPLKSVCHFQTLLQMGRLLKKPV